MLFVCCLLALLLTTFDILLGVFCCVETTFDRQWPVNTDQKIAQVTFLPDPRELTCWTPWLPRPCAIWTKPFFPGLEPSETSRTSYAHLYPWEGPCAGANSKVGPLWSQPWFGDDAIFSRDGSQWKSLLLHLKVNQLSAREQRQQQEPQQLRSLCLAFLWVVRGQAAFSYWDMLPKYAITASRYDRELKCSQREPSLCCPVVLNVGYQR